MSVRHYKSLAFALAIAASLTLSGCVSTGTSVNQSASSTNTNNWQSIEHVQQQAATMEAGERAEFLLLNAEQLMTDGRPGEASRLADLVDAQQLDAELQLEYAFLRAKLEINRQDAGQALFWLHSPIFKRIQLSAVDAQLLHQLRAQAHEMSQQWLLAAQERINLAALLQGEQRQTQHNLIWSNLNKSRDTELQQARREALDEHSQGWLELALLVRQSSDLAQQLQQVTNWKRNYPQHPASTQLPGELASLLQTNLSLPPRVALLLPFSGQYASVAQAIQQGFMQAYFLRQQSGLPTPEVLMKDSEHYPNLLSLYDELRSQEVEFIVGPLRKEQLQQLLQVDQLSIPTLALNQVDAPYYPDQLFMYSLQIEDEAKQLADQAWQAGQRRPLLLIQQTDWAKRAADAFSQRWQELGGQIQDKYQFNADEPFVERVKDWLQLSHSVSQIKALQKRNSGSVLPGRRQDIDMIFTVAQPQAARQLLPALAFNFASDLPVYATSHIYSGQPNPQLDQDLNGVHFTLMPILLKAAEGSSDVPEMPANLLTFYAMGKDAFELFMRLPLMQEHHSSRVYGESGNLWLTPPLIQRELSFVKMRSGTPYPLLTNQPQD
ncbi:penicillin-binding protein activator [Balneatrix alpica]|uniref:Penicillin-binding protein activator n=1 Tax=Balneatrix alpica TaxID=75684 RepID=A0ABV5Z8X5_9GAMM|nr:penicillin-binding protein activator [Balneatrix alpica]